MKKISTFLLCLTLMVTFSACNVTQELSGAYNMINCKYNYNSISSLRVSGMDLSRGISLTQIPQLTALFAGKNGSIPVNFNLNVDVNNPNQTAAMLHGLQYIVSIDGIQFTTGTVNQSLNIEAGQSRTMPISVGFDLATLMKGDSKNAVVDIAKNLVGINGKQSQVSLQLKPTFMIGNRAVTSPVYIPVTFAFGGKK